MQITIDKLVHGGSGMGEIEGKKVFVPYSAPGDVLDVEITADHGSFLEGRIVAIVEGAPCRRTPRCSVFGKCGGCQWQHISYEAQLEWKKTILEETLKRIGKIEKPFVLNTLASPRQWNYRNRIQLHRDSKGRVGFYRPNSKEVVEFDECAIADERINEMLKEQRAEIAKRDRGIALRIDEEDASFAQINTEQNDQLKKILGKWISSVPNDTVLELYAGSGNFTFEIAKIAGRVFASDIDKRAIEIARKRQMEAGICNVEFVYATAEKAASRLRGGCDVVIADPPRKGCIEAIEPLVSLGPGCIIYISCDPATLSRDAALLCEKGYHPAKTLPIDMFPQTFHIESMTMFVKEEII